MDFGFFESVGKLSVHNNPLLANVTLGPLATVNALKVTNNPLLTASAFDTVRTFESEMSGNASVAP
jgi:hypothetical protein